MFDSDGAGKGASGDLLSPWLTDHGWLPLTYVMFRYVYLLANKLIDCCTTRSASCDAAVEKVSTDTARRAVWRLLTDSTHSPDCLLILLSISVFAF